MLWKVSLRKKRIWIYVIYVFKQYCANILLEVMELILFCLSIDTAMSCNNFYFSVVIPKGIGASGSTIIYCL